MRRSFVVAVTLWIALCTVSTAQEPPTQASVASDKANALFDEYWEWTLRELWLDGRQLPSGDNLENLGPAWYGHSVAQWQGDTLVVNTVGLD